MEVAVETRMGTRPDYTQQLQFDVPTGDQGDPDEVVDDDALEWKVTEAAGVEAEEE